MRTRTKKETSPSDPADRFFQLFRSNGRAHGTYDVSRGRALTVREQITAKHWKKHLSGKLGIGLVPILEDNTCIWGAIDVDIHGKKAVEVDLKKLSTTVVKLGLPLWVFRSKSGGAHLVLFLKKPYPAGEVISHLREWAQQLKLPKGIEIFPKQSKIASNGIGNWLNMPYFNGDQTNRFCVYDGKTLSVDEFMKVVKPTIIEQRNPEAPPPCLMVLTQDKLTDGSRNVVLFNYGIYLRKRFPDDWEEHLHDFAAEKCRPRLKPGEITSIIKSLKKQENYQYQCQESPLIDHCNKDVCGSLKFGVLTRFGYDTLALGNITKIKTRPPTWIVDVNGETLTLETTQLQQHRLFKVAVFEHLNLVIPNMKAEAWDRILSEKMSNLIEINAPDIASDEGLIWDSVLKFCQSCTSTDTKDVLSSVVFVEQKKGVKQPYYAFKFSTLFDYLRFHGHRIKSPKDLHFALKEQGAVSSTIRIDDKVVSGVYKIHLEVIGSEPKRVAADLSNLERYYGDI